MRVYLKNKYFIKFFFLKKNKNSFLVILVRMNKNGINCVQTILNAYKRKNMLHNSMFFDIIRCIEMKEKT